MKVSTAKPKRSRCCSAIVLLSVFLFPRWEQVTFLATLLVAAKSIAKLALDTWWWWRIDEQAIQEKNMYYSMNAICEKNKRAQIFLSFHVLFSVPVRKVRSLSG